MCREITKEEALKEFLAGINFHIYEIADGDEVVVEKLKALARYFCYVFDGVMDSCALDLVIRVHESDKAYHIENGDNYYRDGMVINKGVYIHDMLT